MKSYDVIIIGAGPAGLAAALTLRESNLKVALFDKDSFPRDKICGDGLCDRTMNTVKAISEDYYNELIKHHNIAKISTVLLRYKNKTVRLSMKLFGNIMPRYEFDNFLMEKVKSDAINVDVYESCQVIEIENINNTDNVTITTKDNKYVAPIVIVANGFRSKFSENLTGVKSEKTKQAIGIRAYYSHIKGVEEGVVEFHINKKYFPGYLWIFPLKNGLCNVGYGYHLNNKPLTATPSKQILAEWISSDNKLSERFSEATQVTKIKGAYIPVSELNFDIAGNNYMLAGDAASLVDPITGGGIGNGLLSGYFAALQAIDCHKENDFSSCKTINYLQNVRKRMEKDMAVRIKIKNIIMCFPIVLNVFFFFSQFGKVRSTIIKWHTGK